MIWIKRAIPAQEGTGDRARIRMDASRLPQLAALEGEVDAEVVAEVPAVLDGEVAGDGVKAILMDTNPRNTPPIFLNTGVLVRIENCAPT
jgi:hypothetical protein